MVQQKSKTKGQTIVVGFLLVIGVSIALIAYVQVSVYPDINQEKEFESQEESLESMINLRSDIQSSIATGSSQTVSFNNEIDYPFQPATPPDQRGQITFRSGDFKILGAEEVIRYKNGTIRNRKMFKVNETNIVSTILYEPQYVELSGDSRTIRYDNNVIREQTPNNEIRHTNQSLINGNQLNLIAMKTGRADGIKTTNNIPVSIRPTERTDIEIKSDGTEDGIQIVLNSERNKPFNEEPWSDIEQDIENVKDLTYDSNEENLIIELKELSDDKGYNLNLVFADIEI